MKSSKTDCIFCKIASKETPAEVLYENEHVIAVLDINPIHYGHALIIPKQHCNGFLDLPDEIYHSILQAAKIVTQALVQSLTLEGYNLFSNNGTIAGQSVFHFHLHITPRYRNDNIRFVLNLKKYSDGEMKEYGTMIRKFIKPPTL
ncbi:MAG: HIT family protein [Ignavibacteriales bacterium]|nr:HIT family protein [Ignavibacteriales bacterium]